MESITLPGKLSHLNTHAVDVLPKMDWYGCACKKRAGNKHNKQSNAVFIPHSFKWLIIKPSVVCLSKEEIFKQWAFQHITKILVQQNIYFLFNSKFFCINFYASVNTHLVIKHCLFFPFILQIRTFARLNRFFIKYDKPQKYPGEGNADVIHAGINGTGSWWPG